jgi:hypothetical protein
LNFSKKYLLFVEIPLFCSNIEILDYRELSIIFATKTDNSITQKLAKLLMIDTDNFQYINSRKRNTPMRRLPCPRRPREAVVDLQRPPIPLRRTTVLIHPRKVEGGLQQRSEV